MQSDVTKALLLALLDPSRPQPLPPATVNAILADVESWLVRRMLVRASTKGYTKFITDLIGIVQREPANTVHSSVRDVLARQRGESTFWPDDTAVRNALVTMPIYKRINRTRLRMVLEAIEDHLLGARDGKGSGLEGVGVMLSKELFRLR